MSDQPSSSAEPHGKAGAQRPNVLFILADQHNAKVMGHAGHPDVKTPHLDRLAAEGTCFENAITQNPICTPSRTCFHSGQYAHNHGIYNLCGPKPELPNVYGHFRRYGYTTGAIGKIHCPENWIEDQVDFFRETTGSCSVGGSPEYHRYLKENGHWEVHQRDETRVGLFGQSMDGYLNHLPFEATPEGYVVDQAKGFMGEAQEKGQPFLLHVSFPRPHQTYAPTEAFWKLYDADTLTMPPNWKWDLKNKAPHLIATRQACLDNAEALCDVEPKNYDALCRRKMRGYLGNISMVDHSVGLLMEHLKALGLEEDTIVVYSADHGDYACEHGVIEKAPGICSDAITRIPYIWKFPGTVQAEQSQAAIAESVDVVPTLCRLAGLPQLETADGKDITGLLKGGSEVVHEIGVTEFAWSKSVRKGDWRYVYYPREMFATEYPEGFGELYNVAEDPYEMKNLYFDPSHKDKALEMERDLMDWLITTTRVVGTNCAPMPEGEQSQTRYKVSTHLDGKIGYEQLRRVEWKNYL